jgi:hypothetical protein
MLCPRSNRAESGCERGQASLLLLGVVAAVLAGAWVLFAFGNALGAKGIPGIWKKRSTGHLPWPRPSEALAGTGWEFTPATSHFPGPALPLRA